MGDWEAREAGGRDVLRTLGGSEAVAQGMAAYFDQLGALGSIALRTGAGEIWTRDAFSRRDRSLVVISLLTALARDMELRQHIVGGLSHGLSRDEIDEIFVQVAPYAGVPLALGGAGAAAAVFAQQDGSEGRQAPPAPAEPKENEKRRADGLEVLRTLLGQPEGADMAFAESGTLDSLGEMGRLVLDYAFGDVWSRPQLSRRDRSLVVVSVLTALNLHHELEIHLGGALEHGVTRSEIEELMLTAVVYCGFPRAIDGAHLMQKVFAARDAEAG